jgi:hypothetical protein
MKMMKTQKGPYLARQLSVFRNRQLVNLWIARIVSDGVQRGHEDVY